MSYEEFLELLRKVVKKIGEDAGFDPAGLTIDVCLQSPTADPVSLEEAASFLYAGAGLFYKVINIGVFAIGKGSIKYLMVKTGYPPGPWKDTWNTPAGWGPFKQITSYEIRKY